MRRRLTDLPREDWYAETTALAARRSGLVFAANRRAEAEAAIARAIKAASVGDGGAYLTLIREDTAALDALVDLLAVGETHFMRDPGQMDLIRKELLPAFARRRGAGAAPRVWSAGCATGEEAYSLAILLEEEGMAEGAVVLGTDLSSAALEKARAGSYSDWSMREASAPLRRDYFRRSGSRRILVERIRNRVRFERLNLVGPEPYTAAGAYGMDLILCRNVLVYFDRATAGRVAERLFASLAEGGVLLTAGADQLLGEFAPFEVEVTRSGLVYRRPCFAGPAEPPPPIQWEPSPPPALDGAQGIEPRPEPAPAAASPPTDPDGGPQALARVLAEAHRTGSEEAERTAQAELRLLPLDAPLHYLRGALLLSLARDEEAEKEAQRALYLDRSLAVAHFLLGTLQSKRGADPDALHSFRNVQDLCAARPSDEDVPAGDGERVGALHGAASAEVGRLEVTLA